jgi:hypothetical protein
MITGPEREVKEFKKYVGVGEFSVLGFNFDRATMNQVCGYDPGSEQEYCKKAKVRVGNTEVEARTVNISAFLKEVNTGVGMRLSFILKEVDDIAQSGNIKYVNNKCDSSYVLLNWFSRHEHRKAFVGEADFLHFIRNWLSNFQWIMKDDPTGGAKYPLKENLRLFDGNFNAINDLAKRYTKQTIGVLCGIRDSEKGQKQDTCNRAFLPGNLVSRVQGLTVGGDNSQLLSSLSKYQGDVVKSFLDKAEGQYGYKNFYGKSYAFRDYDPATNVVGATNSAVVNKPKAADELSY